MITRIHEYYQQFFHCMDFKVIYDGEYTLYGDPDNPDLGSIKRYGKKDYYDIYIGDYTVPKSFTITFQIESTYLQFSDILYGESKYRLREQPLDIVMPTSFYLIGSERAGKQAWEKNQHYHATQVIIYDDYFKKYLDSQYKKELSNLEYVERNVLHSPLPSDLLRILKQIEYHSTNETLTPMFSDAKILETIAILSILIENNLLSDAKDSSKAYSIPIGNNRSLKITPTDKIAINKAYDILSEEACNPPTIEDLSSRVQLNSQKLKALFKAKFHMTIWEYTNSIRMSTAASLLLNTDMAIHEIALKVGYKHSGKFSEQFRRTYNKYPKDFRKQV